MDKRTETDALPYRLWKVSGAIPRGILLCAIRVYQATAPVRPKVCRYHPSCSEYAAQSLQKYGVVRGVALAIRRILRCNPLSPGGYDPVP